MEADAAGTGVGWAQEVVKVRFLTGGESHGPCLTGIIEGLPAGLELDSEALNKQLERRQKGYGRGGRMAIEKDRVEFRSGLRFNYTIGSPLTLQIKNRDWDNWHNTMALEGKPPANLEAVTRPRPGHADLAGGLKYSHRDLRHVLERSSARETAMRVAVGTVGRVLVEKFGLQFYSHVAGIGTVTSTVSPGDLPALAEQVERSPMRCADPGAEKAMLDEIDQAGKDGDTLGGIIELAITGVPVGLGSHVHWDRRMDGRLAGALMSIQGIKGVEIGAGFNAATRRGSQVHDPIMGHRSKGVFRPDNRAGGIEGGVTNGETLLLRLAMKPIPTLTRPLPSVDLETGQEAPGAFERSDICAVPSAAVVAEAVAAWELAVAFLEKFGGDWIEEIEASFRYYLETINKRLNKDQP